MAPKGSFLEKLLFKRSLRLWERSAGRAPSMSASELERLTRAAQKLKAHIDQILTVAAQRKSSAPAIDDIPNDFNVDWAWRPHPWREQIDGLGQASVTNQTAFGTDLSVYHDCPFAAIALRQTDAKHHDHGTHFGLHMDVLQFDGSFLSWVIDLPPEAAQDLRQKHVLRMAFVTQTDDPFSVLARINIKHGPNTEQILHEINISDGPQEVEFDLAYTGLNEKRVEKIWMDLIFEDPAMRSVTVFDVTFTRRTRASM